MPERAPKGENPHSSNKDMVEDVTITYHGERFVTLRPRNAPEEKPADSKGGASRLIDHMLSPQ